MSILAFIPARIGSKRLPGKNTKLLGGKPLLVWTIEQARSANLRVFVSTDSKEIADIALANGAEVPKLRAVHLAKDDSDPVDAVLELLPYAPEAQAVVLLQPTSPFRTVATIQRAITLFQERGPDSVVSVSMARSHPAWLRTVRGGILGPYFAESASTLRSQELAPAYELNGLIYLATVEHLRATRSWYTQRTWALIVDSRTESIDIDDAEDWKMAVLQFSEVREPWWDDSRYLYAALLFAAFVLGTLSSYLAPAIRAVAQ